MLNSGSVASGPSSHIARPYEPGGMAATIFRKFFGSKVRVAWPLSLATTIAAPELRAPCGCPLPLPNRIASFAFHLIAAPHRAGKYAASAGPSCRSSSLSGTRANSFDMRSVFVPSFGFVCVPTVVSFCQ